MQSPSQQSLTCPNCGSLLEETSDNGLGCMFCLLQAGIGSEEKATQGSTSNAFQSDGRFGIYEIDCYADGSFRELGRGAMGVTYRATDTSLQRKVALKVIKMDVAQRSADTRERFVREARTTAALRHEHIATVYQFGMRLETGEYFYAMELIEGETLDERVRRTGPLDAHTTVEIARQVTSAIAAAEKHGLVHRDLKPANLMLVNADDSDTAGNDQRRFKRNRTQASHNDAIPEVKIIDFGLARVFHAATDQKSLTHDRFVGTPAFASPEQFEHSTLDVRSDIYSLGETLWFALTGKTPFSGRSLEEIHRAQQSNVLPIEQLKAARVPHRLKSLLVSMLAFEPAARPGTRELRTRLQHFSPKRRSVRRRQAVLAAAATVVVGISLLILIHRPADKSIAVLPFENLSADPANVSFTNGVQDEILTRLAGVADLKVINRSSVLQYPSGAARDLHKIGHQLGVARVVEGSVQRAGNRVRVNAQLIDVSTNRALWAQSYDRDLADVFAIQSEIATSIAHQLQANLSPREKTAIQQAPTSDITAFELYARAKDLLASRNAKANLLEAADVLNQAVAHDPSFFNAYCLLASTHDRIYFFGDDHTPARLALAETAIEKAFRLRPHAGEAHLARAQNLYRGYLDYDAALAELEIAARTLPNDASVFALKGYIQRRQGKQEEAVRSLEHAIDLDPRNSFTLQQIALSYRHLRRFTEERSALDRALAIEPNDLDTKLERAAVDFYWKADPRPLHQMVDSIRSTNPAAIGDIAEYWLSAALAEHDASAAKSAVTAAGENPAFTDEAVTFSPLFMKGVIARMAKDDAGAYAAFTAARAEQQKIMEANESFGPAL
ncbi:MAG TPA: protein kinase, partial [Candidatus Udaeobacter sp.]|nr:protein kinase [Candidatus Udaeobacter sp.]